MIDRAHDLPITKQAAALNISRGSVYYLPRPVSAADLAVMRRLDELHLAFPFAGSRLLRDQLAAEGSKIGRRHVTTLMKRMGIEAPYRRPRTTKPEPGHKVYVSAAWHGDHATEPGLGDGHHVRPHGARLCLSGRGARLVQSPGSVVARVDHNGGGILRRDVAINAGEAWQAGDLPSEQAIGFGTQAASGARSAIRAQGAHPTQATPPPPGLYRARPGRRRGVRWERGTASTRRNRAQSRGRTRRRRGRRRVRRRSRP